MNWIVVAPLLVGLVVLRLLGVRLLVWCAFWWGALYVFFQYGFTVPIPQSAILIYLSIGTLAILSYAASSRERASDTFVPVLRVIVEPKYRFVLLPILIALPAMAAYDQWASMNVPLEAPIFARTVHPAPPPEISVHKTSIDLIDGDNPYRELEASDPAAFAAHVASGRKTYYENCFYCHGDAVGGDGMFAHGLNPIPTNFRDANVLPNFRESFFFWRIAKGGPGMPAEGGPGDSAMPAWEKFLSEEEIWDVILFLYDFAGYKPRAKEHHGDAH